MEKIVPHLEEVVEHFSKPYKSSDEAAMASIQFDKIVALLLESDFVSNKFDPDRIAVLSRNSSDLSDLLVEIGGENATSLAALARQTEDFGLSSIIEFGREDDDLININSVREQFYIKFKDFIQHLKQGG